MRSDKITARQAETLRQIHKLTELRGGAPTISELGKALRLTSDQGVIELLQRLEAKGLIELAHGQSRSMKLSSKGFLTIGVIPTRGVDLPGSATAGAIALAPHQQRIAEGLSEIDPKLAEIYRGGLWVLRDAANPDRIAQSALSIREVTYQLSNQGKSLLTKEEEATAKTAKTNNARQLEKLRDPLGGVRYFDQTLYDTWNNQFHSFFVQVSHHKDVTLDEYVAHLARFEEFLNRYVFPSQAEIYTVLDQHLHDGPDDIGVEELRLILSRNVESYRYFFRHVDVRWLNFLDRNNLLKGNWETAEYLARIAAELPSEIAAIIERTRTDENDWMARRAFVDAAMQMPPEFARRLITKIAQEQWLRSSFADWISYRLKDFLAKLINTRNHSNALDLARVLLEPPSGGSRASRSHLASYHCGEIVKQFASVPPGEIFPYLGVIADALHGELSSGRPGSVEDGSWSWCPAIEELAEYPDIRSFLVTALRDGLQGYAHYAKKNAIVGWKEKLKELFSSQPEYPVLKRLRLHLYRLHATEFENEIDHAILAHCDEVTLWHEYSLLVRARFSTVDVTTRQQYLGLVDAGPNVPCAEEYVKGWKAMRLSLIRKDLTPAEEAKYAALLALPMEESDSVDAWGGPTSGPTSPVTALELAAMPTERLIEYLLEWIPSQNRRSLSREGLGRELSSAVARNASLFSREALKFTDSRLRPAYLYHFFLGLYDGLNQQQELVWEPVLELAGVIVDRAIASALREPPVEGLEPPAYTSMWEATWHDVLRELARLLTAALELRLKGPTLGFRGVIWKSIAFLCEHPDPTPEREGHYGADHMDPVSFAINTVRGTAFRTLFSYIFWCDRHQRGDASKGRIVPEAKAVLEKHLDTACDPSLAIRSIYGEFFPWLHLYDPEWASGLVDRLFPPENSVLRYAAWETYLSDRIIDPAYKLLRPQYEKAIGELQTFKETRRFWSDPVERLAHHMMTAYAYELDDEPGPLWLRFFLSANGEQRAIAVSYAGRAYVQREESATTGNLPGTGRLRQFWNWRLSESKDADELRAFGSWASKDKFEPQWLLEHILETLQRTRGAIDEEFRVLATLRDLSSEHPLECARALELLVKARTADHIAWAHDEDIKRILSNARYSMNTRAIAHCERTVDHLLKLGFETYRSIDHVRPIDKARKLIGPQAASS